MSKVFLCHSTTDKDFVRELARILHRNDISAWIDEAEILAGESLVKKIADAIPDMDFFLFVSSQASANSRWANFELEMAMSTMLQNGAISVILVRLDDTEIPLALRGIRYVDCRERITNDCYLDIVRSINARNLPKTVPVSSISLRSVNVRYRLERLSGGAVQIRKTIAYYQINNEPDWHTVVPSVRHNWEEHLQYKSNFVQIFDAATGECLYEQTFELQLNSDKIRYEWSANPEDSRLKGRVVLPPKGQQPEAPFRTVFERVFCKPETSDDEVTSTHVMQGLTIEIENDSDPNFMFRIDDDTYAKEDSNAPGRRWKVHQTLDRLQPVRIRWCPVHNAK